MGTGPVPQYQTFSHQVTQLGIVAALSAEAKCLAGWPDEYDILDVPPSTPPKHAEKPLLSISGIGPEAAHTAAASLVKHGATALLSWGCAGALSNKLEPGDLLLPHTILTEDNQTLHPHEIWRKRLVTQFSNALEWHDDILVESNKMVSGIEEKQTMAHVSGAVAVDMESAAIGRVASQAGIPFIVIRAVVDSAGEELPPCIAETMSSRGLLQMRKLLPTLILQPALWPKLIRLSWHFHAATRTLKIVSEQSGVLFHIV
jgi:adenosylhomocysteine nucleosidase